MCHNYKENAKAFINHTGLDHHGFLFPMYPKSSPSLVSL